MKVSVPAVAPPTPPETGASSVSMPAAAPASCALRALSTSMVELSMISAPFGADGRRSAQAASTCRPAGSMVTTTSAPATASRALPMIATPVSAAVCFCASIEVVARDPVSRLDQVGGHRPAHVAQTEKCDVGHSSLRFVLACLVRRRYAQHRRRDEIIVAAIGRSPSPVPVFPDEVGGIAARTRRRRGLKAQSHRQTLFGRIGGALSAMLHSAALSTTSRSSCSSERPCALARARCASIALSGRLRTRTCAMRFTFADRRASIPSSSIEADSTGANSGTTHCDLRWSAPPRACPTSGRSRKGLTCVKWRPCLRR